MQVLLDCLEYSASSYYLTGSRLSIHPAYSHAFRLARERCGLEGVFTLKGNDSNEPFCQAILPVVYVCKASSEEEAAKFHQLIWNQNIVPFFLVETPNSFRLYSGFRYDTKKSAHKDQFLLEIAKTANEILSKLSEFKASAINSGALWARWGGEISPETRVDTRLLTSLKSLSLWRQNHQLPKKAAHALIGKYVYLHYLRDRDILSERKLSQWGIKKESVFGRNATLTGFRAIIERLDSWLNGTVFPIPKKGPGAPDSDHIKMVAGTFSGDDPKTRQMHLDFKAYDFQHIPIETLSVVYQQFLHSEGNGRGQGAFYTPIHLVNLILDELDAKMPLHKGLRIFDPACGSGAFLVQCYRRVIEREANAGRKEPFSPFALRDLLTHHIFGVDVDEDACGVTELSLLLALLDYVDPPDLEKEAYRSFTLPALRGNNIFYCPNGFFDTNASWQKTKPDEGYDWIVGNPPWKNLHPGNLSEGDNAALAWMNNNKMQFPVSNNQLAEAFAWEASRHLSDKGLIGLLLPALTLFKTSGQKFRQKFFNLFNVWCVVNFANLRHLLFQGAVNPAAAFFYSHLREDDVTNSRIITYAPFAVNQLNQFEKNGQKRKKLWAVIVNANEVKEIPQSDVGKGDSLPWKIVMWGSHRDRYLLLSLAKKFPSLSSFAQKNDLDIHEGIQLRAASSIEAVEPIEVVVGKKELDKSMLAGHKDLFSFPEQAFKLVEPERAWVRKGRGKIPLRVCYSPHIIVHAARNFAVYSDEFIVVPPRQIGIAGSGLQAALLKALALYLNSDFVGYHQFLSSSYFGVERDRPDKTDLEKLPIPLDGLPPEKLSDWAHLYDALAETSRTYYSQSDSSLLNKPQKVNNFSRLKKQLNDAVYELLQINETEQWLIEDLLSVRKKLNEGKIAREAVNPASEAQTRDYAMALKKELDDFLDAKIKDQHKVSVYRSRHLAIVEIHHPRTPPAGPVSVSMIEHTEMNAEFETLKSNLLTKHGQWIYFNKNLKIYAGRTTYFIKSPQAMNWLKSQALLDADELIAEKLTRSSADH